MRIVSQLVSVSYSPFLALPAPKIAGLLPVPKIKPPLTPFVYAEPCLTALPDAIRAQFATLASALLSATIGLLADERTEAEFALSTKTFVRQVSALYQATVIGDSRPLAASPFAARRQQLNDRIDAMLAESKVHMAETHERIARELAAMRTGEVES